MHFVNAGASGAVALTFGTYAVRNVNSAGRAAFLLTKCTLPGGGEETTF